MDFVKLSCGSFLNAAFIELVEVIEDMDQDDVYNIVASTKNGVYCIESLLTKQEAEESLIFYINRWRSK